MMTCRMHLDEMLKPGTVKHLLKKREILRSSVEDVTDGNVDPSERFLQFDKVSEADVQRYANDIPQLEKEVKELAETVHTMAEQRREDSTAMLKEVQELYGAPLHMITERQRRSLTTKDSMKALPLLLKLVKNLYLEFTTNYKKDRLLKIMVALEREELGGFRMLLREAPYCNVSDRQGSQLAAEIDAAGKKRLVCFHMENLALMRAICAPSSEEVEAAIAGPDRKYSEQIDALKEKFHKSLLERIPSRIPLVVAAHSVFDIPFQLADDTHIEALPLHECKQAVQTFVKAAQNLYFETTVCGKRDVVQQREADFFALEKKIYKDAYLELCDKLDEQLAAASNANAGGPSSRRRRRRI